MKKGSSYQLLATVLINVCYRLYAEVVTVAPQHRRLSERGKQSPCVGHNGAHAYCEMFQRRLERGQCQAVPCLGWKEFTPSYVGPFRAQTEVCDQVSTVLPSMLYSVFSVPKFGTFLPAFRQNVSIENGVLSYA